MEKNDLLEVLKNIAKTPLEGYDHSTDVWEALRKCVEVAENAIHEDMKPDVLCQVCGIKMIEKKNLKPPLRSISSGTENWGKDEEKVVNEPVVFISILECPKCARTKMITKRKIGELPERPKGAVC